MSEVNKPKRVIGRAENISFPELKLEAIPARIDTGARTAAIWASNIAVEDGRLTFTLFDKQSPHYTGEQLSFDTFGEQVVASSTGIAEKRFKVKLLVKLQGKKIRASFTLANRATQVYPVLIGRNVLMGKFIVDVKQGKAQHKAEKQRIAELQSKLKEL